MIFDDEIAIVDSYRDTFVSRHSRLRIIRVFVEIAIEAARDDVTVHVSVGRDDSINSEPRRRTSMTILTIADDHLFPYFFVQFERNSLLGRTSSVS
jgi:hypothetical protein